MFGQLLPATIDAKIKQEPESEVSAPHQGEDKDQDMETESAGMNALIKHIKSVGTPEQHPQPMTSQGQGISSTTGEDHADSDKEEAGEDHADSDKKEADMDTTDDKGTGEEHDNSKERPSDHTEQVEPAPHDTLCGGKKNCGS